MVNARLDKKVRLALAQDILPYKQSRHQDSSLKKSRLLVCLFRLLVFICNIRSPDIERVFYESYPGLCPVQQCRRPGVTESDGAHSHSKVTDDETECFWEVSIISSKRYQGML